MSVASRVAAELVAMAGPRYRPHAGLTSRTGDRPEFVPAALFGLLASAAAAAFLTFVVRPFGLTPAGIRNLAAAYVLLTAGLAWVGAYSVCRHLCPDESLSAQAIARLTCMAAVWIAPLTIFLRDKSEWSLLAVVVLIASITRLLDFLTTSDEPEARPTDTTLSFSLLPANPLSSNIAAVLLVEVAVLAMTAAHPLVACLLIGAGTWLWVRRYDQACCQSFRNRLFSRRVSPRLSAASLLTLLALLPHLLLPVGGAYAVAGGSHWSVIDALKIMFGYVPGHDAAAALAHRVQGTGGDAGKAILKGPVFPGVVLFGDARVTTLVAPPASSENGMFGMSRREPLTIPFQGVYWILRRPDEPPPKSSLLLRGSPTKRTFTSNDFRPLWMEAHDNLSMLLDARYCSAVRVEITDADVRSKDVGIELLLNNSLEHSRSWSLGVVPLAKGSSDEPRPLRRTLTFLVPRQVRLERFNEFTVRFRLAEVHSYRSARISIDDFVLLPRGTGR